MLQFANIGGIADRLPGVPQRGNRMTWLLGRGAPAGDREAFFIWQERALDYLLAWGVGSVLAGSLMIGATSGVSRVIGVQAVAWGTIETAVALYGSYWARQHAVAARAGILSAQSIRSEANRFSRFLAINSTADVAYLAGGILVAAKSRRPWVRGTAIGVAIQGGALLAHDLVLSVRTVLRPETGFR